MLGEVDINGNASQGGDSLTDKLGRNLKCLRARFNDLIDLMTDLYVQIDELKDRVRTLSDTNETLMADKKALTAEVLSLQSQLKF
ncbi:unnamed protein product [Medioppia subpectinata]|uniref:Uncharacterized protein n=1 Tax=Medioppia subpectinata TaxID=1979941 RepID=A0A7R9KZS6_9ACAR|nr:unnamed protein product [Medioppia subpectinata]CAG2111720.1 unnamed protein product [Medioppia subpectinata]